MRLMSYIQLVQDVLTTPTPCSSTSQDCMLSEETESEIPVGEQQLPQESYMYSVSIQVTPHRRNARTQAIPKTTSIGT